MLSAATPSLRHGGKIPLDLRSLRGKEQELTSPGSVARSGHPDQGARLQAVSTAREIPLGPSGHREATHGFVRRRTVPTAVSSTDRVLTA